MAVRADLIISLDGFGTKTDQTPEQPFGEDWSRLVGAYAATKTFRERVFKDTTGEGATGIDDNWIYVIDLSLEKVPLFLNV